MTEAATDPAGPEAGERKGGRLKPLLGSVVLAAVGAAGGYFAASSGLPFSRSEAAATTEAPATAFVEADPMIVSVVRPGGVAQLRLRISLEVAQADAGRVADVMPRVTDVLIAYLRALETVDIGDAATLVRLRAQMLRRVQIVIGGDAVKDLLIQEFVVN